MKPPTFTITNISGVNALKMNAGGSLVPSANGAYIKTSPGVFAAGKPKASHLRLIK